ncbi:MAG TPA: patatin-like phospholipase family protein, partial [Dokdonella sp.]|uniref:patatin-like phospholipase family protein n=1 Tax=Dokdonella sp. TaxID=2291710 RepID=UPI002D7FD27D
VIFGTEQLAVDALLASTCLPQIFAPVTIDGETYWDGAWAGNPTLEPLIGAERSTRLLGVLVQPLNRNDVPMTPEKIATRIGEFGSSSAFLRELRSLVMGGMLGQQTIQLIEPGEPLHDFHDKKVFSSPIGFLSALRDHGRHCAEQWVKHPERHVIDRESGLFQAHQSDAGHMTKPGNDKPPKNGG